MEIVVGAEQLVELGGAETYLLTVAPHLERLGHQVTLWSERQGAVADLARAAGMRVAESEPELPERCGGVLANDGTSAILLAARYPGAARAMVVHGADNDLHLPPQLDGVIDAAVVMNDASERRIHATARPVQTVRLRQPIDAYRFHAVGAARARPARVLLLGNTLGGPRRDALVAACRRAGLECSQLGRHGATALDPRPEIARADIVVGQGRSVLEAMACGRAVWVFGPASGDGWVTAESYPAIEADGFRGRATRAMPSSPDLPAALAAYRPEMGEVNRSLVLQHHSAFEHANALAALLHRLRPATAPEASVAQELARLKRSEYVATARALDAVHELRAAHEHIAALSDRIAELETALAAERARLASVADTRRWRTVQRAARPLDLARRAIRRR
jgi:hypothetical protein